MMIEENKTTYDRLFEVFRKSHPKNKISHITQPLYKKMSIILTVLGLFAICIRLLYSEERAMNIVISAGVIVLLVILYEQYILKKIFKGKKKSYHLFRFFSNDIIQKHLDNIVLEEVVSECKDNIDKLNKEIVTVGMTFLIGLIFSGLCFFLTSIKPEKAEIEEYIGLITTVLSMILMVMGIGVYIYHMVKISRKNEKKELNLFMSFIREMKVRNINTKPTNNS